MEHMFEPLVFQDITSSITDNSDAFLSFSSLSNFETIDSLFDSDLYPLPALSNPPLASPSKSSGPESVSSFGSASSSPKDVSTSFFDFDLDLVPLGEVGIFHTPSNAGPSRLGKPTYLAHASYGSSYSDAVWTDPSTPALTAKGSSDFGSVSSTSTHAGSDFYHPTGAVGRSPYQWDDQALSASTSSPYHPVSSTLRVTSNPSLRSEAEATFKSLKQVKSMPALQEEPVQVYSFSAQDAPPLVKEPTWQSPPSTADGYPSDSTAQYASTSYTESAAPLSSDSSLAPGDPASWDLTVEDVNRILAQEFPLPELTFSTDYPAAEDEARPSSAPGLQMSALHPGALLSVPAAGAMTRSLSANGFVPHRSSTAGAGSLFNFAPQQFPAGDPGSVQPLFTTAPQTYVQPPAHVVSPTALSGWEPVKTVDPRDFGGSPPVPLPSTPRHHNPHAHSHLPLNVQITPAGSTYSDEELSAAPLSARSVSVTTHQWDASAAPTAAMEMMRVASNPIPRPHSAGGPAHSLQASPISYYAVGEPVPIAPIHLEQPLHSAPHSHPHTMSAPHSPHTPLRAVSGPAHRANIHSHPFTTAPISYTPPNNDVFTTTPLGVGSNSGTGIVHPPPASYTYGARPVTPTRIIHPPPYTPSPAAGPSSRRIASLPTRGSGQRSPSSPSKRKGRQAQAGGGGFEMSFINYTSKDAQKLLTGVAPSGSQNKRKRDETVAGAAGPGASAESADQGRDKRSRSRSEEGD